MAAQGKFKVVIAGGSIAGLSLANMLQANDIDFVVLEAYPSIAPQVGASIGLLPHGNRILDQLGLYEKMLELAPPVDHWSFRNSKAQLLAEHKGLGVDFMNRHGYPILFLDRQMVLKVLWDNIRDKGKVLTKKRVIKAVTTEKGVTAITEDGSSYSGDILVGADGIHSDVRGQIMELANSTTPGTFDDSAIKCDYSCIFGISNPVPGIKHGSVNSIFHKQSSYLVIGGLNDRCYWFYFFNNGRRTTGRDFPRYTKAQEEELLRKRAEDKILPTLKFEKLVQNKVSTNITALPEFVHKSWHYGRIMTIGDSAHKFEPITGHGGNAAIETAATLTNRLLRALKSTSDHPDTSQISSIFEAVQHERHDRVQRIVDHAHEQQRLEALEGPWQMLKALYMLPMAQTEDVMFSFSQHMPLSEKLDNVQLPIKDSLIPFQHDLASLPKPRGRAGWLLILAYLLCAAGCYYGMWIRSAGYGINEHFETTISQQIFSDHPEGFPLKTIYTRIPAVDEILQFLDAAFTPGIAGFDKNFWMLQLYFLGHLVQPITIYAVESVRKRNSMTIISFVSLWAAIYQLRGIGFAMPLWYVAYTWISDPEHYWWALNRSVTEGYDRAILPAVLLGYVVPTGLMFWPWNNPDTIQNMVAFWQPSPVYVQILLSVFGYALARSPRSQTQTRHHKGSKNAASSDMPALKSAYVWSFVLGVILHVFCMYQMLWGNDRTLNLGSVFYPDFSATPKTHAEGLRNLWLPDFYAFFGACYIWCCAAFWDLQRVGRLMPSERYFGLARASILILLGQVIIGPGATMSAVWYWREIALARTSVPRE